MAEENISQADQVEIKPNPQANAQEMSKQEVAITSNSSKGNKKGLIKKIVIIVVLIAVIAGLIVTGMRFYKSWQIKQRDSQRKADIKSLEKALEAQKAKSKDQKSYPAAITEYTMVKSGAMNKLPVDPLNKGEYTYHYKSLPVSCVAFLCTNYELFACLENKNDSQGIDPIAPCTTKSYKVSK